MRFLEYLKYVNIIYVEDDKVSNDMISKILNDFGFNLKSFYEPLSALKYLDEIDYKVELIISDISMPNLDGISFIKKVREIKIEIPVILTTAFTEESYFLEAISVGVNSYIKKPIEFEKLKNAIDKAIYPLYLEKKTKEQNRLLQQQSKDLLIAKTVSMISHQWKQPLTKVSSIASKLKVYLEMDEFDKEKFLVNLEKIQKENKYLASIIDKFDNILKTKEYRYFCIDELVNNSLKILNDSKDNKVDILVDIHDKVHLHCDFNEFSTVILNILTNSLESFEKRELSNRKILISSFIKGESLYISIKDNALGLKQSELDKVFDLYYSNQKLNKKGLGLYFVRLSLSLLVEGDVSLQNIKYGNRDGLEVIIKIPNKYFCKESEVSTYDI